MACLMTIVCPTLILDIFRWTDNLISQTALEDKLFTFDLTPQGSELTLGRLDPTKFVGDVS
jgi:hypothetical protein